MTVTGKTARHRADTKTVTPFTDLTGYLQQSAVGKRGVALASATGVALTAGVAGAASADTLPSAVVQAGSDDFVSNLTEVSSATLVSLDIDWEPGDEVAVKAEEPEPEIVEVEETAVSRSGDREAEQAFTAAPAARMGSVVGTASQFLGTPYVYGGAAPGGFDCSGLTSYVYGMHGISLPRSSYAQAGAGVSVGVGGAQPGDLVIMSGGGHVGIYVGGGQILHSPRPGRTVEITSMGYFQVNDVRRL